MVCLLGCLATLCGGCGGVGGDCDACNVVCVGCEYAEGDDNAGVGDGGGVVAMSAGHEYVGGTRGPGIVSSAVDVLEMSVMCVMRGIGGLCEM